MAVSLAGPIANEHHVDAPHRGEHDGRHDEERPEREVGVDQPSDAQRQVVTERDHRPEDAADEPALAPMKPGRVDLYDGDCAEALEVHVRSVKGATVPGRCCCRWQARAGKGRCTR